MNKNKENMNTGTITNMAKENTKVQREINNRVWYESWSIWVEWVNYRMSKVFSDDDRVKIWKKYGIVPASYIHFLALEAKNEELHKLLDMDLDMAGLQEVLNQIDKRNIPFDGHAVWHEDPITERIAERLLEVSKHSASAFKKVAQICSDWDVYCPDLKQASVVLAKTETDNRRWIHIIGYLGSQTYDSFSAITGEICVSTVNHAQLHDHDSAIAVLLEGPVREFYKGDCWSYIGPDGMRRAGDRIENYFRPEGFLIPANSKIIAVFGSEENVRMFNAPDSVEKHYTSMRALDLRAYMSCEYNKKNIQKLRALGIRFKVSAGWHAPSKKGARLIFVAKHEDFKTTRLSGYSWDGYAENPITGDYYDWNGWGESVPGPALDNGW